MEERMKGRKVSAFVITVVFALSAFLANAQNGSKPDKSVYKIAAIIYGLKAEYANLYVNALLRHPDVVSGKVKVTVFDSRYDPSVQLAQFETVASQDYDGIITIPQDFKAAAACLDVASDAKLPVVVSNARVDSDKMVAYVGSDDVISGRMEAESVLKRMGYKGNVVILEGPVGGTGNIERGKGNVEVISKYPNVKIIERKTANWSRGEALSLMENWISAHPGQINGVIGQNDEMALGAIQAMEAGGLDPRVIPVAGIDGVTDAVNAVKAGKMASILQDATGMSQGSLDVLLKYLIGDSFKPKAAIWKNGLTWTKDIQKWYNVPWTEVTLANADVILSERAQFQKR
jgi:putative xylitol transport system substrate-binding protein